jgi:hypothetical protein
MAGSVNAGTGREEQMQGRAIIRDARDGQDGER